jgi:PAS domain S-box-containing protein
MAAARTGLTGPLRGILRPAMTLHRLAVLQLWPGWIPRAIRCGIGVVLAIAAVLARVWWLEPILGPGNSYLQSYPVIFLAAWIGGLPGGLLATFTSALGIAYTILPPESSFAVASLSGHVSLAVFIGVGALMSGLLHAREQSRRQAEKSEDRYRSLVELSPDAVFVHAQGRVVYANASTIRLLGASDAAQVLGRQAFEFVAPQSQSLARARTQQLFSSVRRVPPVEQEWVRLDGGMLPVEVTAARVPWGDGEAIQVVFRDISQRRRADEERQTLLQHAEAARAQAEAARAEAEKASRLKEEFLAVLSHELRTPLNAVLGWARIIKNGATRGDHLTHALTVIERNATAQVRIVEDLLDLSRIITGQFQLRMQRMDLRQATTNAVESVRPAAGAKDISLDVVLPPEDVGVLGDPVRIQQVIWNLLTNAVKFTEPGGLVNLTVRNLGAQAELMVSDTGIGISPEFLPYVFDRFRQQDSSTTRAASGLGLGLSLVRHLVEAHGGRVRVSSAGAGSGSIFVVTLPLADARRAADVPPSEDVSTPHRTARPPL